MSISESRALRKSTVRSYDAVFAALIVVWYLLMPLDSPSQVCTVDSTSCSVQKVVTKQSDCLSWRSWYRQVAEHPEIWPPAFIALAGGTPAGIKDFQGLLQATQCIEG
jgi:hypothetical protein